MDFFGKKENKIMPLNSCCIRFFGIKKENQLMPLHDRNSDFVQAMVLSQWGLLAYSSMAGERMHKTVNVFLDHFG